MTLSDYLVLIPSASQEKARFMAITEAVIQQVIDLQVMITGMNAAQSVDYAEGVQLDVIANSLGKSRNDATNANWDLSNDEYFRLYLKRKMIQWTWNGSNSDAQRVLALIKPDPRPQYCGQMIDGVNSQYTNILYYNGNRDVLPGLATEKDGLPVPAGIGAEIRS